MAEDQLRVPPTSSAPLAALVAAEAAKDPDLTIQVVSNGIALLNEMERNPEATAKDYRHARVERMTELERRIKDGRVPSDPFDKVQTAMAAASGVSLLAPIVSGSAGLATLVVVNQVNGALKGILQAPKVQDYINGQRALVAADERAEILARSNGLLPGLIDSLAKRAANNPTFDAALREAMPFLKAGDTATAGQCLTNHPEVFNSYTTIRVAADQSLIVESIDGLRRELTGAVESATGEVRELIVDGQSKLAEVNNALVQIGGGVANLERLAAQARTEEERRRQEVLREQAERARREFFEKGKEHLATAGQLVGVAAAFASLIGEAKLAGDITKYGGAAVKVGESLLDIASAGSKLGLSFATGDPVGMITGAIGLAQAVMSLTGLWQDDTPQPTPDELILNEVRQIRADLAKMSEQIEKSFAAIDEHLTTLHRDVMSSLDLLVESQAKTQHQIEGVRATLVGLQQRMVGIEVAVHELFQTDHNFELSAAINAGLGYGDRDPTKQGLSPSDFNRFSSTFYTYAVRASRDKINQPMSGPTDDHTLSTALNRGGLATNVSLIDRALADRGLPHLTWPGHGATADLAPWPNSDIWGVAAAAYAQLRGEWPRLATTADSRRNDIFDVGANFAAAIRALATTSVTRELLISGQAWGYAARLDQVAAALDNLCLRYQREELPGRLGCSGAELGTVSLFEGERQQPALAARVAPSHVLVEGTGATLPCSAELLARQVPSDVGTLCLLTGTQVQPTCVFGSRVKTEERYNPKTGETYTITTIYLTLSVHLSYDGRRIAEVYSTSQRVLNNDPAVEGPARWPDLRQAMEAHLTASPERRQPIGGFDQQTRQAREALRPALWAWLRQQLDLGSAGAELQGLSGARTLLENVIRLTLPLPRTDDDIIRGIFDGEPPARGGLRLPGTPGHHTYDPQIIDEAAITAFLTQHPSTTPGTWLRDTTKPSIDLLLQRLTSWQEQITNRTFANPIPQLADPLLRQGVADALVTITAHIPQTPVSEDIPVDTLPTLLPGDTGPNVRRLQGLLRAATSTATDKTLVIDGTFGPQTAAALTALQAQAGLTRSGRADSNTWRHLLGL